MVLRSCKVGTKSVITTSAIFPRQPRLNSVLSAPIQIVVLPAPAATLSTHKNGVEIVGNGVAIGSLPFRKTERAPNHWLETSTRKRLSFPVNGNDSSPL